MKTGVIIYTTGDPPQDWTEECAGLVGNFETEPDMVKIITRATGHFDVHDAWFELVSKGMVRIICKIAAFNDAGQMMLTGRKLRLCG